MSAADVALDAALKEYRAMQREVQTLQASKAQFLTQLNENDMVKKELELLDEAAEVYKLIGPVLVKQEKSEASSNVNKRLEFINAEMKRLDAALESQEKKAEEKRKKISELQQAAKK